MFFTQPCCQNLSGCRNTLRDSDTESQSAIWLYCSKTLHYGWLFTRPPHRTTQAVASTSRVHDLMHPQLGNFKLRQSGSRSQVAHATSRVLIFSHQKSRLDLIRMPAIDGVSVLSARMFTPKMLVFSGASQSDYLQRRQALLVSKKTVHWTVLS